ncbi:hypothetical protein DBR27_20620 [Flavobacterium sp. HMWF030]|nr:hypothetical protein DBR27_20620 [Flavobacterium sp. HMWF030]
MRNEKTKEEILSKYTEDIERTEGQAGEKEEQVFGCQYRKNDHTDNSGNCDCSWNFCQGKTFYPVPCAGQAA